VKVLTGGLARESANNLLADRSDEISEPMVQMDEYLCKVFIRWESPDEKRLKLVCPKILFRVFLLSG